MKSSWIMTWVIIWLTLAFFGSIAEQRNLFELHGIGATVTSLTTPEGSNALQVIINAWEYVKVLISALALWFPTLWAGNWIYVYYFVCLPIVLGGVYGIVSMIRGYG